MSALPGCALARGRRLPARLARTLLATAFAASFSTAALVGAPAAQADTTAHVAGTVFEDFNANGSFDPGSTSTAADVGVAGATITVADSTGATVGTATSLADGTYDVPVTAATSAVRVRVAPPSGYEAGPHGSDSGSTVQFVALGSKEAAHVDVALVRAGDFAQDAPQLAEVRQASAIGTNGNLIDQSTQPTVVSDPYTASGTAASTVEARADQTGSLWGIASYDRDYVFTGAFLRRHAQLGPGGPGAIYVTHLGGAADAGEFVSIPDAGTDPHGTGSHTFAYWFHDSEAYGQVGKVGLGGLAVATDRSALYAVNLNDRHLYRVPLSVGAGGAPVAGTPVSISMPLALPGAVQGCPSTADVRPFGLAVQNGSLWATLTCTGPGASDLRGYVYRYDLDAGSFDDSPAFEFGLEVERGTAFASCASCSANWHAWSDSWPTNTTGSNVSVAYPQPLLSDVGFDSNGDMTIGIKDRFADQIGYEAGNLTAGDGSTYEGFDAGDTLRACGTSSSGWTLESAGHCGTRTGYSTSNHEGPGGGEFYYDNYHHTHDQTSLGALLQVPGYTDVISSVFDPITIRTAGVRFLKNSDGLSDRVHELAGQVSNNGGGSQGGFGKAGGLGDLTALIEDAPLELGNRLWLDSNFNGVQDAGEDAIGGATVHLYGSDGTTLIATAVTAADGTYYFSSGAGTDTASSKYDVPLEPGTHYVIKVDHAADFDTGGVLAGLTPTQAHAGTDRSVDSNGTTVDDADQAPVTTGGAGANDHTIDFGFTPPTYAVGDYVWVDADSDGTQGVGEIPLAGASVILFDGGGQPATHPDGSPVAPAITDAEGHYVFDFLAAGSYQATFTLPSGYTFTTQAAGSDQGIDSNPAASTGRTPVFTIGAVGAGLPNMRPVISADGTTRAVAIDSTIDAGVIPPPSVKVGDFVWLDGDHDGNQDSSESGIAGVTVTITTADGRPVRDVFGELVGPTLTDANGLYLFSNLPPGTYATHVSPDQTPLAGLRPTRTGRTDREHDSSTGSATSNDLAAGEEDLSLDYGFWRPGGGTTSRGRIPQPGQPGQPARPPTTTTAQTGVPMLQLVRLAGVLAAAGAIFLAAGYRRRWS